MFFQGKDKPLLIGFLTFLLLFLITWFTRKFIYGTSLYYRKSHIWLGISM